MTDDLYLPAFRDLIELARWQHERAVGASPLFSAQHWKHNAGPDWPETPDDDSYIDFTNCVHPACVAARHLSARDDQPAKALTQQQYDFIAVSFRGRIDALRAWSRRSRAAYKGDYDAPCQAFADACDEAANVFERHLVALWPVGSGNQASPQHSDRTRRSEAK